MIRFQLQLEFCSSMLRIILTYSPLQKLSPICVPKASQVPGLHISKVTEGIADGMLIQSPSF